MKYSIAALTTLSLLLAACGTGTPTTTPAPVVSAPTSPSPATPARSGGLYEVHFQGTNGDSSGVTATAQLIRTLGTQALTGTDTTTQALRFERIAATTFVNAATGTRHVSATFRVTNTASSDLTGLTLLGVDTDDADTDPGNNPGSVPTVGTTPFNSVRYFDGSDASSTASTFTPTGGKRFNNTSGTTEADPTASVFLSNQDVSGVSTQAPAGLVVAGIKTYGWKVADTLAAGASANVTFAVDLPASSDPKQDPFAFNIVVTAAEGGVTAIHDIQGSGSASPLAGQVVTTQGVVTADYQLSTQLKGFFIQAPDSDADSDPATSEGLFVLCDVACKDVNVGDLVRVTGTATEYSASSTPTNTITELSPTSSVTVRATGVTLPTARTVTLPVASTADWEKLEGMRVRVQGVVTENYKLGRGGVLKVADSRLPSYTQVNAPSTSGYAAWVSEIARRTIAVDDGSTAQNPEAVYGRGNQPLSASNTLRTGDTADVTGVLHYGFDYTGTPDTWRIESTLRDATFSGTRPAAPTVTGNVTVASANVLNFFTTLASSNSDSDNGGAPCTPDGVDTANSRGANDCFEYKRQLGKVVKNLAGLNADVIGLMEVQNNTTVGKGGDSLNAIVTALNTALGGDVYAAVTHPSPGSDAIRVAMIYKKANVTPIGAPLSDTDAVNNRFPLAQVFQASGGSKFAVVVNHLKSKGSAADSDPRNADVSDGQGSSSYRREQQVARLLDLIQNGIVNGRGVQDVIAVGDFNAYAMEPSLQNLQKGLDGIAGTADDLSPVFDNTTYSYQFDAQFGSLDHAFVTRSLAARQVNGEKWHDNSDEPTALDYNKEFKSLAQVGTTAAPGTYFENTAYRSSDHDPLKVGFELPSLGTLGVTPTGNSTAYTGQPYTLSTPTTGTPDTLDIDWGDGSSDTGLPGSTTSRTHTYASTGTPSIVVTARRGTETATGTQNVTVATPGITVNATNATRDVSTSGATTAANPVTVTRSGYADNVTLTANVTGSGTAPTVTVTQQPGTGTSGTVSVDGSGATVGTYTVTVTASGAGVSDATTTFTVNVNAPTTAGKLVISQVYGGGGSTSTNPVPAYKVDYVELFNAGGQDVNLSGKSLQYGATSSTTFTGTYSLKNVVLKPGQYYLLSVSPATGTGGAPYSGSDLTGADDTTTALNMAAANGKIAIVNGTTAVSTAASTPALIDLVGYGTASTYEGTAAAPAISTVLAAFRKANGCQDTNQNSSDFTAATPAPRNSASPLNVCP